MYDWLDKDETLDKQDPGVQNLMRAVQNRARHVMKHEKNPDYEMMRHPYKVLVEGGHKLKINPKHLSYNFLHYDLRKKVGDPRSKRHRHTYFAVNMDDDDRTEDNTGVLNEYNELVELDGVSAENDLQSFERTAHAMFPDPSVYATFKASQGGKVIKGFFKQPYVVRKEFGLDPDKWVADLRKTYPNTYLPTVQQICRKWMTTYSKQHQLQKQSGLTKKQWSAVLCHAASAVARHVKEKKIKLEGAKSPIMMAAIHDTYKVYYKRQFSGWNTESNADLLNMIRLLRQKKINKDKEAESHRLGDREIEIFNRLEARGDPDRERYNKQISERYLKRFVTR
jgi:hypothetical protein